MTIAHRVVLALTVLAAATAAPPAMAQSRAKPLTRALPTALPESARSAAVSADRGAGALRAVQLLEQRRPGAPPRVRFAWQQVPGARAYLLSGRWAEPRSWTLQAREFIVTPSSSASWGRNQVSFDASLPEGAHSWMLTALFGPDALGDFEMIATLSFDIR